MAIKKELKSWNHNNTVGVVRILQRYHPEVNKVVDARRPIDIEVKASDCAGGDPKSPNTCALAHAFKRTFDGAIISRSRAYLIRNKVAHRYFVPVAVHREIVSFDRAKVFQPGTYTLLAPQPTARLGRDKRKRPSPTGKKNAKTKNRLHTTDIRTL